MIESGAGGRWKRSPKGAAPPSEMNDRLSAVKLLPGEKVKGEAGVRSYDSPRLPRSAAATGILLCTNFRVAFVPARIGEPQVLDAGTAPLGLDEVALSCIERLVAVGSSRSKVLTASSSLKFHPEELVLHCRDLRVLHFLMEPDPRTRQIITLIAQSCRPESPRDLFVFDYALEMSANSASPRYGTEFEDDFSRTRLFESHLDWENELERTEARGWRVSLVNERFEVSASLSKYLVVPRKILDLDIKALSALFTAGRIPCWHWHHAGSNLLRMGTFQSTSYAQRDGLRKLEELVSGGHSRLVIADLGEELPSPADIQQAYSRLRSLCTCELPGAARDGDERWLSSLESTRWLEYVRLCLKKATEVAALLWNQRLTVTLQESDDRDLSCLVASLVQLILDPQSRTLPGFQSLVQKEWVSAGHRFSDRFNLLRTTEREESPVFLLFLDCVWQLLGHHPFSFEFTDTYLLAIRNSTHIPLSGTFLFNCCRDQLRTQQAPCSEPPSPLSLLSNGWPRTGEVVPEEQVVLKGGYFTRKETSCPLPSVWDWSLHYSREQQLQFQNALYTKEAQSPVHNRTAEQCTSPQDDLRPWRSVHLLTKGGLLPAQPLPWKIPSVSRRLAKWSRSLESLLDPEPEPGREPLCPSLSPATLPLPSLPLPAAALALWRGCYLRWERPPPPGTSQAQLGDLWAEVRSLGRRLRSEAPANGPCRPGNRASPIAMDTPGYPKR
ncbi:myotubularin-related protein 11-like [Pristis pectinata]|uniref:myotubularin-related protein 11-like n=1 Tax=Pristis pectinata TaxID=685728 RepID=UPI00223D0D04|nr:myotubularin-related protein 11-like [Pristis pectinata]